MHYQIDQSGKVENTSKDTVLAMSGKDLDYTIKITAKTKRKLQTYFRSAGEPRLFIYKTFTAGLFILLNTYNMHITRVQIDKEYPGKEQLIGKMIKKLLLKHEIGSRIQIQFQQVGKSSMAHKVAYNTAIGKIKESRRVGFDEIKKIVSYLSPE